MLNVLGLDEAIVVIQNQLLRLKPQTVALQNALGRVLAQPIIAAVDVPAFDRTQVDGLAVCAADTFGASESLPAILDYLGEVNMGVPTTITLRPGQCAYVPTGGMIPPGADAMVMIEYVEQLDVKTRLISQRVSPGQSITRRGDDTTVGQVVFSAGQVITAADIGALASLGQGSICVEPILQIGVLSTGDELVEGQQQQTLNLGQIWDVNRPMMIASVQATGHLAIDFGIAPDQLGPLTQALQKAIQLCDLVLISGGSSAGTHDFVAQAIQNAGSPGLILHGLAVKPGKPTMAGICDGTVVIGLPGHPVAAWFMFEQLVKPVLTHLSGEKLPEPQTVQARLTNRLPSNHGREEFVLVRLEKDLNASVEIESESSQETNRTSATDVSLTNATDANRTNAADANRTNATQWLARPAPTRSGLITLLTTSEGYIRIPRDCEGLEAGTLVLVYRM